MVTLTNKLIGIDTNIFIYKFQQHKKFGQSTNASRVKRTHKFRLINSLQLATALYHHADIFLANNQKHQSFKELPIHDLNFLL